MWLAWVGCAPPSALPTLPSMTWSDPRSVGSFDLSPVPKPSVPLAGGLVAVNADWVAASDADGDRLRFVRRATDDVFDVALPSGWSPAQIALTSGADRPRAQVLLRGTGGVAVVDLGEADEVPRLVQVFPVCPAPRGLAWDPGRALTWIACGGGDLVGIDLDGVTQVQMQLDADLRDVVVLEDGRGMVARTKAVEVLVVDLDSGAVTARWAPPARSLVSPESYEVLSVRQPRVLGRLVADLAGGVVALFQYHQQEPVATDDYGGDGPCGAAVLAGFSEVTADGGFQGAYVLEAPGAGFVVDIAPTGGADEPHIATTEGVGVPFFGETSPCLSLSVPQGDGLVTGVAVFGADVYQVTRDPFALSKNGAPYKGTSVADVNPGLGLFYRASNGVACASCHADGDEDGHTWILGAGPPRRTLPLGGLVLSETAPYGWTADHATFDDLFESVGVEGMGLASRDVGDLLAWLDGLPRPPLVPVDDPAVVDLGSSRFDDPAIGCAACHSGWRYTNGESADVGTGGAFQAPSLLGVGARGPWMHDGCAETLSAMLEDASCGGGDLHGAVSGLTADDRRALVAFLESL